MVLAAARRLGAVATQATLPQPSPSLGSSMASKKTKGARKPSTQLPAVQAAKKAERARKARGAVEHEVRRHWRPRGGRRASGNHAGRRLRAALALWAPPGPPEQRYLLALC